MKPKTGWFSLGHVYMRDPYIIYTSPRACGSVIKENFKSLKLHRASIAIHNMHDTHGPLCLHHIVLLRQQIACHCVAAQLWFMFAPAPS